MQLEVIASMGRQRLALTLAGARCYLGCPVNADAATTEAAILAHPIAASWWAAGTDQERAAALASRP